MRQSHVVLSPVAVLAVLEDVLALYGRFGQRYIVPYNGLNFKFELFFVFPFGTISYREAGYFSATGLTVSPDKEATGNTLSNEVGEEDFPVASASGPCRDWQPAIELCRKNKRAFGMECVWGTAVRSKMGKLRCYKRIAFRLVSRSTMGYGIRFDKRERVMKI